MDMLKMDKFTTAYLVCALWSSTEENGTPLDANYGLDDIADETLAKAQEDCRKFQQQNQKDLETLDAEQAGHDFWLTRNHHGAGFFDRDLEETGKRLTEQANLYKEVCLYVGDDGEIYS
jgi:hypothetical protein